MLNLKRQIIALGGRNFSMEPNDLTLERYILEQAKRLHPEICFLPAATGGSYRSLANFYATYARLDCRISHLTFFDRMPEDLQAYLLSKDIIYVGGGNTKSTLAVWKEWGMVAILREAWDTGVVLAGVSAGAICWFQQGITDSVAGKLGTLDCLVILHGSCCPHYNGEAERRPTYRRLIVKENVQPGFALDNNAALDDQPLRVVRSHLNVQAYRVYVEAGEVCEKIIVLDEDIN